MSDTITITFKSSMHKMCKCKKGGVRKMRVFRKKSTAVAKQTPREKLKYVKKNWQLYVFFLLPGLLLTLIFKYGPMGGILIAFEDYNVIEGVLGSPWVGLDYFRRFLSSPDFMNYLMNTLKLSVFGLLWGFPIPIILALLLNQIRRTGIRKKIQLLIYAPNFISVIVLCGMVRMFLSPVGPINSLFGIDTNWMTMPEAFRTIYIASGIWQTAGWSSIMYTAALSNASKDLEEAAIVDGARSGDRGRSEYPAADPLRTASCDQRYHRDPVYPSGRQHHEHRI